MDYQLEERECVCGCGEKFKVMPWSEIRFASKKCQKKGRAIDSEKAAYRPDHEQTRELRKLSNIFGVKQ